MTKEEMLVTAVGHHLYAFFAASEELAAATGEDLQALRLRLVQKGVRDFVNASPEQFQSAIDSAMGTVLESLKQERL